MLRLATLVGGRGEEGTWWYAFVGHNGARGEARRLDRNLFYLAMVSELRRMGSPYRYAVVWHDAQNGIHTEGQLESGQSEGSGYGEGAVEDMGCAATGLGRTETQQTATHQTTMVYQQSQQQQQGPGQARTPLGIRQRREEGERVMYLVGFLEGGPERWMGGEELRGGGEGGRALVEEWERRYAVEHA